MLQILEAEKLTNTQNFASEVEGSGTMIKTMHPLSPKVRGGKVPYVCMEPGEKKALGGKSRQGVVADLLTGLTSVVCAPTSESQLLHIEHQMDVKLPK